MLLGAAQYLAQRRDFEGVVNFIFQLGEEGGNAGARSMQDGLFERLPCGEVYGVHQMPGSPVGTFSFRMGDMMASSNRFDIVVRGVGDHAATPQKAIGPIVIVAEIVGVLQALISRIKSPIDTAVLSVTQIHAGDAYNVIPDEAVLRGTVRTFSTEVLDLMESRMRHVAEAAFGADKVVRNAPPVGGAEDYSFFLEKVPGAYVFVGNGDGDGAHREATYHGMGPCELHNPSYDFNDGLLPIEATYWVRLVEGVFGRG